MKLYSSTLLPDIKKSELKVLTTITKETLDSPVKHLKKFTAVDFWNIQKLKRNVYFRQNIL